MLVGDFYGEIQIFLGEKKITTTSRISHWGGGVVFYYLEQGCLTGGLQAACGPCSRSVYCHPGLWALAPFSSFHCLTPAWRDRTKGTCGQVAQEDSETSIQHSTRHQHGTMQCPLHGTATRCSMQDTGSGMMGDRHIGPQCACVAGLGGRQKGAICTACGPCAPSHTEVGQLWSRIILATKVRK